VQLAHRAERRIAHIQPRLHQVAEFEQPHAELIRPGFGAVDEAGSDEVVEDAMRGGGMQPGALGEFLQADRVGLGGQGIEQRHQPVDDLDGGLAGVGGFGGAWA
jgi:hypothetical protein